MLSFLAHKEWRFIIYTVPFFNLSASVGASYTYVCCPSLSRVQLRWLKFWPQMEEVMELVLAEGSGEAGNYWLSRSEPLCYRATHNHFDE